MKRRKANKILIKNSFKTAIKNWTQLIGVSVLIALFALILSLLSNISSRVVKGYNDLNRESVLHDFISDQSELDNVSLNDKSIYSYIENNLRLSNQDTAKKEWNEIKDLNNTELTKQYLIDLFSKNKNGIFDWTRTESRTLTGVSYKGKSLTIKAIAKTGSGVNSNSTSDKIVVSSGSNFSNDDNKKREVIVSVNFARYYSLIPGTIVRLAKDDLGSSLVVKDDLLKNAKEEKNFNDLQKKINADGAFAIESSKYSVYQWYVIKGIGSSSDFSLPIIDQTTYLPDVKSQALIYVDPDSFGLFKHKLSSSKENTNLRQFYEYNRVKSKLYVTSNKDREISFSCKFKNDMSISDQTNIVKNLQKEFNKITSSQDNFKNFYLTNESDYIYYSRVKIFDSVIRAYTIFSRVILIVIILLTFITISLITKKQIDAIRKQVGTLKALGYPRRVIINNFLASSLITSIAGCLVGYLLTIPVEYMIVRIFGLYFSVFFTAYEFSILQLFLGFIGTYLINLIMVFISGYAILSQPALELLKGNVAKQISRIGLAVKKIYRGKSFSTKLRSAIATSSIGKMIGVITVMLTGSFFMSMSIIAPKVLADNKSATFNGINYKSQYVYNAPVASNPFSFYKTYNYTSDNQRGDTSWGYFKENNHTRIQYGLNKYGNGLTAYPLTADGSSIDWEKVIPSLTTGSQPADYYSFNVSSEAMSLQNILSLQWRNISSKYLEELDKQKYNSGNLDTKIAIIQMYSNWKDFSVIKSELNNQNENIQDIANSLLWFYKVYTNGIQLKWNDNLKNIINDKNQILSFINSNKDTYGFNSNFVSDSESVYLDIIDLITNENPMNISVNLPEKVDIKTVTQDMLSNNDNAQKVVNRLYAWLNSCILDKIGTAMLLTTYSSLPYYAQQNILDSIKQDKVYNISFGLIPFDPKKDEVGTALDTLQGNSNDQIMIYGIDKNTKQVSLRDDSSKKIIDELYKNNNQKSIIINETMAKKAGLKVGQSIELNVRKNVYSYKDNDLKINNFEGGWTDSDAINALSNNPVPASAKLYINKKADSYSGDSFSSAGYRVDGSNELLSLGQSAADIRNAMNKNMVSPTGIQEAYSKNDLSINNRTESISFKVVGIQNGYGASQAWIANDKANEIMEYDKTQKWMFYNYFVPEWFKINDFKHLVLDNSNVEDITAEITEELNSPSNYKKFVDEQLNNPDSGFDKLLKLKNTRSVPLYSFFNNQYPVFNYKSSLNSDLIDITRGVSSWQKLGDYSVCGLTGGEYKQNSKVKNFKDVNKVLEGMQEGAISLAYPLTVKKEILSQISSLVNIVLIMIVILTFIISVVIVMLVTNLIIYENSEFIATMKILGYSNRYTIWVIIRLYLTPLFIMFFCGFGLGWFVFSRILNYLAFHSSWVMSLYMDWYIPIIILISMSIIFIITFAQAFSNIKKIKPLIVLQQ